MTTIAANLNGVRPVEPTGPGARKPADWEQGQRLSRGQTVAVAMSVALGVVVAGYGLAGSYLSISDLADRHHVPLAGLVPAGIDGGLVAVVVLDLVLTWIGFPVGWLRQFVRVLSVGTVAANGVAGWPDPVATGLHTAAPLMLLAMIEAGRTVLLRRIGRTQGTVREPVPLVRWVLAPWRTLLLWRRMALWQITSYRVAIDAELRLRAVTLLRASYGRRWRRRAPGDLVWMVRTGVAVDEACARVQALLGGTDAATTAFEDSSGSVWGPAPGVPQEPQGSTSAEPVASQFGDTCVWSEITDIDRDRFAEAVRLNRQHWVDTGRPISAETLRQRLHVSADTSRKRRARNRPRLRDRGWRSLAVEAVRCGRRWLRCWAPVIDSRVHSSDVSVFDSDSVSRKPLRTGSSAALNTSATTSHTALSLPSLQSVRGI